MDGDSKMKLKNIRSSPGMCFISVSIQLKRRYRKLKSWHEVFKDDRAFSLLDQELPQILILCFPKYLLSKSWKENWGHPENLGQSGGQTFKGSDREKCQF